MNKKKTIVHETKVEQLKSIKTIERGIERGVDQFMKDHVIINTSDPESEQKITKSIKDDLMKKAKKEIDEVLDND